MGNSCYPAVMQAISQYQHEFEAADGFCVAGKSFLARFLFQKFCLPFDTPFCIGDRRFNLGELVKPIVHHWKVKA